MPQIAFSGYLTYRLPARGVPLSGLTAECWNKLPFGTIVSEFRQWLKTNKLAFSNADLDLLVRPHRTSYHTSLNSAPHQAAAKMRLIQALDAYGERLRRENNLFVTMPAGSLTAAVDPLTPGYSVAGGDLGAGTIGGFIIAGAPVPDRFLLSNAHVLAANPRSAADASVVHQPARRDGAGRRVGQLAFYTRISDDDDNTLDAGLARLDPGVQIDASYGELGRIAGVRDPVIGETLRMYCRTSGYAEAHVAAVGQDQAISLPLAGFLATVPFAGITLLSRGAGAFVCLEGDSGGLWIGADKHAVLLNFSGGGDSDKGWGIPMTRVMAWVRDVTGDAAATLW